MRFGFALTKPRRYDPTSRSASSWLPDALSAFSPHLVPENFNATEPIGSHGGL